MNKDLFISIASF